MQAPASGGVLVQHLEGHPRGARQIAPDGPAGAVDDSSVDERAQMNYDVFVYYT